MKGDSMKKNCDYGRMNRGKALLGLRWQVAMSQGIGWLLEDGKGKGRDSSLQR